MTRTVATTASHGIGHQTAAPAGGHVVAAIRARKLSPIDYVREYHGLLVNDPRQRLFEIVSITRYQQGPTTETAAEKSRLVAALAKILKVKRVPSQFRFPWDDVMDAFEPFYREGLDRAFGGKGSPREMADALRLAVRCRRIGKGTPHLSLTSYAKSFLGLDCNGLVGNYFGLSPAVSIGVWALGEPGKLLSWSQKKQRETGWGPAELATTPYVPLTPRHSALEARNCDVLITLKDDGDYKHIAMVDKVTPLDSDRVHWTIVEWGQAGNENKHISSEKEIKLEKGKKKGFGVGFPSKGNFRYLFAAPNTPWEPATWGRCGQEDI